MSYESLIEYLKWNFKIYKIFPSQTEIKYSIQLHSGNVNKNYEYFSCWLCPMVPSKSNTGFTNTVIRISSTFN